MKPDLFAIRMAIERRPPAMLVSALLETHLSAAAIEDAGTLLHSIGPLCDRVEELEIEVERLIHKKCVHTLAKEWSEQITENKNRLDLELWRHR